MLASTTQDARTSAEKLASEAEIERLRQQEELARAHPAADSSTQIKQIALVFQQQEQAFHRLQDERQMLASQLEQTTSRMESNADTLQQQRAAWQKDMADSAQRKGEAQFMQVVKQFEQIPPKQAKKMLETLVTQKDIDQAVAYLAAMNPRAASKVLREFKTDSEVALATELLERLRTRGLEKGAAPTSATPPAPAPAGPSAQEPPPDAAARSAPGEAAAGAQQQR
jgi:hypothetical protein